MAASLLLATTSSHSSVWENCGQGSNHSRIGPNSTSFELAVVGDLESERVAIEFQHALEMMRRQFHGDVVAAAIADFGHHAAPARCRAAMRST